MSGLLPRGENRRASEPLPKHALEKLLADAAEPLESETGARIGRYVIVREVGRGGMGIVYEATDPELGRRVALKVLSARFPDDDQRARFVREARSAARLDHPGIAAVFEAGDRWIAMRFVDGVPLARYPRDDVKKLVTFVRDAALAVHAAHEQGIVHRDIKPANLIVEGERVIITDFGLAKDVALASELSVSGHVLGTPAYMSPEQAQGRVRDVDARTDVWGLGATLYDLLAGLPPFAAKELPALLRALVEDDPPSIRALRPAVPRDLEIIVRKCLAKERERRYAGARELADDLTRWLEGRAVLAEAPSIAYRLAKFARRRRGILALSATAGVALLIALGATLSERAQSRASGEALGLSREVSNVLIDAAMHTRLGDIEASAERLEGGIAACRTFLEKHDVAAGHALLGRLLRAHRRSDEARVALDRALELDPDLVEARFERGLLLTSELGAEMSGMQPPAGPEEVQRMDATQRAQREQAVTDLSLAQAHRELLRKADVIAADAALARLSGDRGAARRQLEDALRLEPLDYDSKIALSQLALVEGSPQDALRLAMSAVDLHRGLGPAYLVRSEVRAIELEGHEMLLADTGQALQSDPSDATAHAQRAVILARRAAQLARTGWPSQAADVWESSIDASRAALLLAPDLGEARINLAAALAERARLLASLDRKDESARAQAEAASELDRIVVTSPEMVLGWLDRAILRRVAAEVAERSGDAPSGASLRDGARSDLDQASQRATDERLRTRIKAETARLGSVQSAGEGG